MAGLNGKSKCDKVDQSIKPVVCNPDCTLKQRDKKEKLTENAFN